MSQLAAYNFLAKILSTTIYANTVELNTAINSKTADARCIPSLWYTVYNIDTLEYVAELWTSRSGFEVFKTQNGQVIEHYKKPTSTDKLFISLDLVTHEVIEYYKMVGPDLAKFDSKTDIRTGHTTDCSFDTLPDYYKDKLKDFVNKDKIFYWADKPYGKVVGVLP